MKEYILIVGLLFPFGISAQNIIGKVTDDKKLRLWERAYIGLEVALA